MNPKVKIFEDSQALVCAVANDFMKLSQEAQQAGRRFNVALSGGKTPTSLFQCLVTKPYQNQIPWNTVHIFWGDERCVPPINADSNYGTAKKILLDHVPIPSENIHRIRGEAEQDQEVKRYSDEIGTHLTAHGNSLPQFDWILLGLGADGHTASLFPNAPAALEPSAICISAAHPVSCQKRISLTLSVINMAKKISFLVTGKDKSKIVGHILSQGTDRGQYPASHVNPKSAQLEWYLDKAAANTLKGSNV